MDSIAIEAVLRFLAGMATGLAIVWIDCWCYRKAKWPDSHKWYYIGLPLGGIAALIICGRGKP